MDARHLVHCLQREPIMHIVLEQHTCNALQNRQRVSLRGYAETRFQACSDLRSLAHSPDSVSCTRLALQGCDSRCTDNLGMCHQQCIDPLPLCCSHELTVPDARYVNVGWHDTCASNHRTCQGATPCLIDSCTCFRKLKTLLEGQAKKSRQAELLTEALPPMRT